MGEMKPTKGPWVVIDESEEDEIDVMSGEYFVATCLGFADPDQAIVNARLIAEAGTVFHDTGLSPVQLVEQRDELLAACKKLVEWEAREKDHAIGFMERINLCEAAFQMMYAALAKCEGVK